jgi:hypothetical protein
MMRVMRKCDAGPLKRQCAAKIVNNLQLEVGKVLFALLNCILLSNYNSLVPMRLTSVRSSL